MLQKKEKVKKLTVNYQLIKTQGIIHVFQNLIQK